MTKLTRDAQETIVNAIALVGALTDFLQYSIILFVYVVDYFKTMFSILAHLTFLFLIFSHFL